MRPANNMLCVVQLFWCLIYLMNLCNDVNCDTQKLSAVREPSKDFSNHAVVVPRILHARTKRQISTEEDSVHRDHVNINVDLDGEEHILQLNLNTQLIGGDFQLSYDDGGRVVYQQPKYSDINFCQYTGVVKDKSSSWVALSICNGIRGVINTGQQIKYIEPRHINGEQFQHYVYDHKHLIKSQKCGADTNLLIQNQTSENTYPRSRNKRVKRHIGRKTQSVIYNNENDKSRYIELLIVVDKEVSEDERFQNIADYTQNIVNIVNTMYSMLDIHVVLTHVHEIRSNDYSMQAVPDSFRTLNNFVTYAKNELLTRFDVAFFFTLEEFLAGVVGSANVGAICSEFSIGIATLHTTIDGIFAATVAHELGHLLGMQHDEDACACPGHKCIMASSSTEFIPSDWSSCSLKYLMLTLDKGSDYCLRNKPSVLYKSPLCGNGIVENGEQCDCGAYIGRPLYSACSACCRADCKLRVNATCATGVCCDLKSCQPRVAGSVCREAKRECDLPELCLGSSEHCPPDLHVMDTTPCAGGEAFCINGTCQSHSQRCHALFGLGATNAVEKFYNEFNVRGNKVGYCDATLNLPRKWYNDHAVTYEACSQKDVLCGKLFCWSPSTSLRFKCFGETQEFNTQKGDYIFRSITANIEPRNNFENPVLVPDGAKCGENMMCLKQRCISIEGIRTNIANLPDSICPSDCSGNGICNSKGHCHCNKGFRPPLCDMPGDGGSIDSGPLTKDTEVLGKVKLILYIIFLAIAPLAAGVIIIYLCRKDIMLWYNEIQPTTLANKLYKPRPIKSKISDTLETNTQTPLTEGNVIMQTADNVSVSNSLYANSEDLNIKKTQICQNISNNTNNHVRNEHATVTYKTNPMDTGSRLVRNEKKFNKIIHDEANKELLKSPKRIIKKDKSATSSVPSNKRTDSNAENSESVKNLIEKFNKTKLCED